MKNKEVDECRKVRGVAARPSVNAKARNKKLQKRLKNKRNKMINSLVQQLKWRTKGKGESYRRTLQFGI